MPCKKKTKPKTKGKRPKLKSIRELVVALPLSQQQKMDRFEHDLLFRVMGIREERWLELGEIIAVEVETAEKSEDKREAYLALVECYKAQINARKVLADSTLAKAPHDPLKVPEVSDAKIAASIAGLLEEHRDVIEHRNATVKFESAAKADDKESTGGGPARTFVVGAGGT